MIPKIKVHRGEEGLGWLPESMDKYSGEVARWKGVQVMYKGERRSPEHNYM